MELNVSEPLLTCRYAFKCGQNRGKRAYSGIRVSGNLIAG